ncbi:MAG: 30S ribosomal protein S2 [Nanoarchaeota archaeon]
MAEQEKLLVDLNQYLKAGVHIGTKFRTKYMSQFIYKVRPDGLSVLNLKKIDNRIGLASKFLANYEPGDIIVVGRRENSWDAIKKFSEVTGIRAITGRYPPGMLTNPALEIFTEAKILLITDPWPDKNALGDAVKIGIPVVAICDTNNESNYIDFVIPCNNKGKKSLGLLFYILAREYLKNRGAIKSDDDFKYKEEDFGVEE